MTISSDTVRHIAQLARLAVKESEMPILHAELNQMLQLVNQLSATDLTQTEPMHHPLGLNLKLRDDEVTEHDQRALFMGLAVQSESDLYLVPKVIE